MRLYKAQTLYEYIKQLESDIKVLRELKVKFDKGEFEGIRSEFFDKNRDTFENHSQMISQHMENLRVARNNKRAKEEVKDDET